MRAAAKPSAEHRYPRGYTPERQAAVFGSLADAPVQVSHHAPAGGGSPYVSSKEFFTPNPDLAPMGNPAIQPGNWSRPHEGPDSVRAVQSNQARRAHVDAIARSTVPLSDLTNLPSFHVRPVHEGSAGHYINPGIGNLLEGDPHGQARGRITIDPNTSPAEMGHTLIHELGHHLDYHSDPDKFIERSNQREGLQHGGVASPALEGYAEGYAQGHVRTRGGETPRLSYKQFAHDRRFGERYEEASGGLKSSEHPDVRSNYHLSTQMAPHQAHLYQRDADIAETRTQQDFGQFPLRTHEGEALGTIRSGHGVPADVSAPGFKPGDAEIALSMRQHRPDVYDIPKEEKSRVAGAWNERYGDEDRLYL